MLLQDRPSRGIEHAWMRLASETNGGGDGDVGMSDRSAKPPRRRPHWAMISRAVNTSAIRALQRSIQMRDTFS
jgi:hypothetical protein